MSDFILAIFIVLFIYYFINMNCGCNNYYDYFENKVSNTKNNDNTSLVLQNDNTSKKLKNVNTSKGLKNESRVNDRYNRKYNNIPNENELDNIRKYNINSLINDDEEDETHLNIANNQNTINNKSNNIDDKIFNKSNRSQKLYKDSKTIANRFTKNSIIEDYKYELDFYQKQKTPWWEE